MLFERSLWKRSASYVFRFCIHLHNNSTMLIPKFKNKVYTCSVSLTNFIFWLRFVTVPPFFYKWFYLINSKPPRNHVFSLICVRFFIIQLLYQLLFRHISKHRFIFRHRFGKVYIILSNLFLFQIGIVLKKWEQHRYPYSII